VKRRTVLIDATVVARQQTGVGWAAVELLRALAAADDPRFRYRVATSCPEVMPELWARPGWGCLPVAVATRSPWRRWRWLCCDLDRLAARCGADLVHTLTMPGPLRCRVPAAVTVHDLVYRVLPASVPPGRRLWYTLTVPRSLARARRILVNSRATGREVAEHFPALASRVRLTRFGTPGWVLRREPPPPRRRGAPWLFVGLLEPRKNVARLVEAYLRFRALTGDEAPPPLIIVGARGWRNRRLLARLRQLADQGVVELRGHADRRELWDLYCRAGLLLFPSLHEGFGFPILEAMAANLPVLTGDCCAMPEVAGDAAIRVDATSIEAIRAGMVRFWHEPGLAERLAGAGRRRALAWRWEDTATATLSVYAEMLDGSEGKG